MPFWCLFVQKKCKYAILLSLKWPPFPKANVIQGHIPEQGAHYAKQCQFIVINEIDLGKVQKSDCFIENGHHFTKS